MIPCKLCPLIPICRFKTYTNLLLDCNSLFETLYDIRMLDTRYRSVNFKPMIDELAKIMKPSKWKFIADSSGEILPIRGNKSL